MAWYPNSTCSVIGRVGPQRLGHYESGTESLALAVCVSNIPIRSNAHLWNRFKLKFSPDKVDTMVIQAIALLDDLDKEINVYSMRVKVCRDLFTIWVTFLNQYVRLLCYHRLGVVRLAFP